MWSSGGHATERVGTQRQPHSPMTLQRTPAHGPDSPTAETSVFSTLVPVLCAHLGIPTCSHACGTSLKHVLDGIGLNHFHCANLAYLAALDRPRRHSRHLSTMIDKARRAIRLTVGRTRQVRSSQQALCGMVQGHTRLKRLCHACKAKRLSLRFLFVQSATDCSSFEIVECNRSDEPAQRCQSKQSAIPQITSYPTQRRVFATQAIHGAKHGNDLPGELWTSVQRATPPWLWLCLVMTTTARDRCRSIGQLPALPATCAFADA